MDPFPDLVCLSLACVPQAGPPRTPSSARRVDPPRLDALRPEDPTQPLPSHPARRPYVEKPEFEPELVKKASKAAYGLCCWVRAMEAYDR